MKQEAVAWILLDEQRANVQLFPQVPHCFGEASYPVIWVGFLLQDSPYHEIVSHPQSSVDSREADETLTVPTSAMRDHASRSVGIDVAPQYWVPTAATS